MPTFREVLTKTIPSKTERLLRHIRGTTAPQFESISRRRQQVSSYLRDNQRIIGFVQPKSFNISSYQNRTQRYFDRLIGGISRFIKNVRDKLGSRAFAAVMTPTTRMYRQALNKVIDRARASMVDMARDLIDRRITISQFRDSMAKQIRQIHTAAAFIGLKSVTNITPNVIEVLQARVSKQLNFLDDFTSDIQETFDKQQELTAKQSEQIINSAGKYASAAKATASDLERQLMEDTYGDAEKEDRVLAMRVLGANENHCMTCPGLSGTWESLDSIIPIGQTPCAEHCHCFIVYARASDIAGESLPPDTSSPIL